MYLMLVGVATCADAPTVPTAKHTQRVRLGLAPRFVSSAANPLATTAAAGLVLDSVRVLVIRPPADTLADTTIAFTIESPTTGVDLSVSAVPGEVLDVVLQYRAGTVILFSGTGQATAREPNLPPSGTVDIPLDYVGPGSSAAAVSISPEGGTFTSTSAVQFSYGVVDSSGAALNDVPVFWLSTDTTVARIGLYDGVMQLTGKRGPADISVNMLNGLSAHAAIEFVPPAATLSVVSGGGQTGTVGQPLAQPIVVALQSSDGGPTSGQPITFSVSRGAVNPASATTDANGRAQTVVTLDTLAERITVTAQSGALTATATDSAAAAAPSSIAIVSGHGQTDTVGKTLPLPFVVKVSDHWANNVNAATVTWTRLAGAGSVSAATSTTNAAGQAQVTYTLGATTGTDTVSASVAGVTAPALFTAKAVVASPASIVIAPASLGFGTLGDTASLSGTVKDANGNTLPGAVVSWVSRTPAVATISATGVVTAVANGTSWMVATSGAARDSIPVSVHQTVASIAMSPASLTLATLSRVATVTATPLDSAGHPVAGAAVTWASRTPSVATVSTSGAVTAVANGTSRIVATAGTVADSIVTTVNQVAATVTVSPKSASFTALGQSAALTATATDSAGYSLSTPGFQWITRNASVASVTGAGVVNAVGNGTTRIVAKSGTGADSATVNVQQVVASLTLARDTVYLPSIGDTVTDKATLRDANSNLVTNIAPVYASLDTTVAKISDAGVVTLQSTASTMVTATAGGHADTTSIIGGVQVRVALAAIRVNAATASPRVGDTLQLTADSTGVSGTWGPITPTWASDQPGRASVDASGILIAHDTGAVAVSASNGAVAGHLPMTVLAAPELTGFRLSPSVLNGITSNALSMTFEITGRDADIGIRSVDVILTGPTATTQTCTASVPQTGSVNTGIWTCVLTFPAGSPAGTWHISQVVLHGTIDRAFAESALSAYGATTVTVNP